LAPELLNIDKETGFVMPPSEPAALRQAMDYLWNNPKKAQTLGKRAEEHYLKLFTAKQMANSYLTLYKEL
jgi:glycosyltransferase involved in cell wall biosynthesis